ncbi:YveK family protein [Cohnella sp. AR92]|uniref:YveK family protein n=1 Tax=Cohnella sp. AR92 TaxID=648716 RepID=UPI000F8EE9BA|nr:Wzz/FepE/Etk N-terminal domain-containing protein [Cohnella sp. AR92]RUS42666.1 lipopolysaccharide biosynthesis protein [Cohnella sp. AR92]
MEIQWYWSVIRKRMWLIALIVIVACTAVGYYTSQKVKPVYQADTKLLVYQQRAAGNASMMADSGSINSNIQMIKTFKQLILIPRVLGKVVTEYPKLQTTEDELAAKIGISSTAETQIMTVTVSDHSYARAAEMANAVSKVFQQEVRALMKLDNVSVINWADPSENRLPVSPQPVKTVLIVFVVSLMLGGGLAFLLEQLDDSVKSEKEINEKLGMPLLTEVPRIGSRGSSGKGNRRNKAMAGRRESNVTMDA